MQTPVRSTSPDMATVFQARQYGRFIEINSNLRKKNLKDGFSSIIDQSVFTRIAPMLLGESKKSS